MKEVGLNAGYVAWWNKTATEDARVLQILSRAGAVFHARTTQPQTLMHLETDSNLFGVTVNPYNTKLSPGGSSGGEGALVGVGGSCLGIGTDIGGWSLSLNHQEATSLTTVDPVQAASEAQPPTTEFTDSSPRPSGSQLMAGLAQRQVQTQ